MKPWLLALGAAAALLTTVACGDDDDSDTTPTVAATSAASTTAVATSQATTGATATRPAASATAGTSPTTGVTPISGSTNPVTKPAVPANFSGQALLKDVRIGLHPETASERIVFEFQGTALPPSTVEYVASASSCGQGAPVTVGGTAILKLTFQQAAAHDNNGQSTFAPKTVAGGSAPIVETKSICDFEGVVSWAVGVTAQKPFVVTQLADPPRLVIDVAK